MATPIRPSDLPASGAVNSGAAIIVDNGATVDKATPLQVMDAARPLASQVEAEAGSDNTKIVSPLRVKQHVDARGFAEQSALLTDGGQMVKLAPERPYPGAPALLTTDDAFEFGARLTRYGFVGNDSADDTQAWRDAIEEARTRTSGAIRKIIVPAGSSVVTGAIVDSDNPLPQGLRFSGEYRNQMNETLTGGSKLKYTGSGTCWDIYFETGGPGVVGDWAWRDMAFHCTDVDGSMFDFGNTATHTPGDGETDPYPYLRAISFERIYAVGPSGGTSQTGDFLRACKVFQLSIDNQSMIRAWRRGVWLKGVDNSRIDAAFYGNCRHIHAERVGTPAPTFGNQLVIGSPILGEVFEGVEDGYGVYDDGCYGTVIKAGVLFEATGVPSGGHCKAHIYLNGLGTLVEKPVMAFAPLFHLGPNAREVTMTEPVITSFDADWAPIIDEPSSWDLGNGQTNLTMRLEGASQLVQATVGANPRIRYPNAIDAVFPSLDKSAHPVSLAAGLQRPVVMSALNYWGSSAASVGGQPIKGLLADSDASGGYAVVLDKTVSGSGFSLRLAIGRDIVKGTHRIQVRSKNGSGWTLGCRKNTDAGTSIPVHTGSSFAGTEAYVSTAEWAANDILEIYAYHPGGGDMAADLSFDYISITPVPDAPTEIIPSLSSPWTAFTDFGNTGPRFTLDGRRVGVTGSVQSGSTGLIFTLPPGFRPNKPVPVACLAFAIPDGTLKLAHVEFQTDGSVMCYTDVTDHWLALGSIMFTAA